jgi:hypothetical protein
VFFLDVQDCWTFRIAVRNERRPSSVVKIGRRSCVTSVKKKTEPSCDRRYTRIRGLYHIYWDSSQPTKVSISPIGTVSQKTRSPLSLRPPIR